MTEDPINEFSRELTADVEDRLTDETPFTQEVFTQLILERLEEAGN